MSVKAILARRWAERQGLLDRAETFVAELERRYEVRCAVVFGSVARGDFNLWSDIDLLLVLQDVEGDPLQRMAAVEPRPPGVQPVIWTPGEWQSERARRNPIVCECLERGVWVRGQHGMV